MDSLPISRRGFCRSALVASSSLVVGGLAGPVVAMGDQSPPNVRVSNDGDQQHAEPCLAVNPRDSHNFLAACMLSSGAGATYASFDGGRNWQSNGPLPLPAGSDGAGDFSAGFDSAGRGFVCGLVTSGSIKGAGRSVHVWRTDDGGRTFAPSVAVTEAGALDRPSLAIERRRPHALHVVWAEGTAPGLTTAVGYARSTDGGQTFEAPRSIASVSRGLDDVMVACGPPGGVYVIYDAGGAALGRGRTAIVTVLCSHDRGGTFDRPIAIGRGTPEISFPDTVSSSVPAIAADPRGGVVCAAFSRREASARHADILLVASRDRGRTWSRAKRVTPRDAVIYFQPQVALDGAGRIGVMAFAMTHGEVSVVLMLSKPGSLRFGRPITVTRRPFNPANSGFGKSWWIGDYQALANTPGVFHPLWNDTRTGQLQLFTAEVRARS